MNDLDRLVIGDRRTKYAHTALTSADNGKPAEIESSLAVVHDGTGVFCGVIETVQSGFANLIRMGPVTTSKTDWTVGAEAWVSSADGSWTETKQASIGLWVGKAIAPGVVDVQTFRDDVSKPWCAKTTLTMTDATPGPAVTATGGIAMDTIGASTVGVQVSVTFGASPDNTTTIAVYGSLDGTTYSTVTYVAGSLTQGTGATKIWDCTLYREDFPFYRISVTNNDTTDDVTLAVAYAVNGV